MMTKKLLLLVAVITFSCLSTELVAQSDVALATRKAKLQELSQTLKLRDEHDRRRAREFARSAGIPLRRELPNGRILELQRIAPGIGPVFYITNNLDAADSVSTDEVWPGGSAGLNLDGSGMVVGEWDGGAVWADHPDFAGRLTQADGATEVSNHSTHVAGTLIGAGDWLEPRARGMAYAAQLNAYDWNSDTAEMALAASNGLLYSNNSYGIAAGWLYIGGTPPDGWWWIGGSDPSDVEDMNFGYYDTETQLWDQIAFDAPYFLIVKAGGNDRTDIGPAPGEEYTVIDQDGNPLFTSTLPRQSDCYPAGYDCLPTTSNAKNILTVGAVEDVIGGYSPFSGPAAVTAASFSSWGPTDDGRIKPDLVGNGVFLISTWGDYPYYVPAAGVSMAAPNVTGSLVLLQQHYENLHGADNFMRAATLKTLAIHTADEAGDSDGPDYEFGWGLLNTKSAAKVITEDGGDHRIIEGSLADGAVDSVEIVVTGTDMILTATLGWTDPPGTVVPPTLDPPDLMLVNDLDLRIQNGITTHMPWVLNPAAPADAATRGDNFRDNIEQVVINGAGPGSYVVQVSHKGTLLDSATQDYSLIISIEPAPPTGSGLLVDEDFSGGLPAGWSIETNSFGMPWDIFTQVPGDDRYDNLTGGAGNFAMVDNNYLHRTVTSLISPAFDLSTAEAVVLRFRSYFYMDTYESINVDYSTDGGTTWPNAWTWSGFNPLPTHYVLDLTGEGAGDSNFRMRFRFDSLGEKQGNLWQIDDIELETFGGGTPIDNPPGQALDPNPASDAIDVDTSALLSWTAGTGATSHDVYFGDTLPLAFMGNQGGTSFDPGTLNHETTYLWRVDEVNDDGTTPGNTWAFTTEAAPPPPLPGAATIPNPPDGATGIDTDSDTSWTAGSDATSHDIYFGTSSPPPFHSSQDGTSFEPGTLSHATTYYWRIDEVNASGTTTGTEWTFTTAAAPPPPPGQATSPTPGSGATDVDVTSILSWTAGTDAASHDVYLSTSSPPTFSVNQTSTSFDPGTLSSGTTYYWRIDEVNVSGTTSGTEWSFTTAAAPALPTFRITGVSVVTVPVKGPRNSGEATITVRDAATEAAIAGVEVSGTFSGDWAGTRSGTTGASGQLVVTTPPVKNGNSWQFCVDAASKTGWDFDEDGSSGWMCGGDPPPPPTAGSISGTVTDSSNGNPIPGAAVSTDSEQNGTTDAGGNYLLSNVPTGTRTVTVGATGYDTTNQQTTVSDGATSTLNFALTTATSGGGTGALKGTVTDTSGAKVGGITVQVIGGPSATTNKGGKYTIQNIPEGEQTVTASGSGYQDTTDSVTITNGVTSTLNITMTPN